METDIKKIVELLGGPENILSISNCMTRLRIVLKDPKEADDNKDAIKQIGLVKGVVKQNGQYQIIIGSEVGKVCTKIVEMYNLKEASLEEIKEQAKQNQNFMQRVVGFLGSVFIPVLPVIIAGGLLMAIMNVLAMPMPFLDGASLTELDQFWAGAYDYLYLIMEATIIYLPVHVTWSAYKKMGGTEILGIAIGLMLVSPTLLNAYAAATTPVDQIPVWDFGFAQVQKIGYQGQVLPALMVGVFGGWFETFLTKKINNMVRFVIVPITVLIVTSLVANCILGPIGWALGTMLCNSLSWLFENFAILSGLIYGFIWAPVIITGMHHMLIPVGLTMLATTGGDPFFPITCAVNVAQGSAVVGTIIVCKSHKEREIGFPGFIAAYIGMTEPAMYGTNLRFGSPFIAGCIGAALGGAFMSWQGVTAAGGGLTSFFGIIAITPGDLPAWIIGMAIATIVPIILTVFFLKKNILTIPDAELSDDDEIDINNPLAEVMN